MPTAYCARYRMSLLCCSGRTLHLSTGGNLHKAVSQALQRAQIYSLDTVALNKALRLLNTSLHTFLSTRKTFARPRGPASTYKLQKPSSIAWPIEIVFEVSSRVYKRAGECW